MVICFLKISCYLFLILIYFLYLCSAEEHLYISMELCNHKAPLGLPLATNGAQESSQFLAEPSGKAERKVQSLGRTELATHYFPNIQPISAWLKLKALLQENPDLAPLSQLKRRTFLPSEVNQIYQSLGQP